MKLCKKMSEENGSITVEASISMVCFTLVMVFLLTLINTCRAQALIQNALDKSALEMSQFMYLYAATDVYYETVDVSGAGKNAWDSATGMLNATEEIGSNTVDVIQNGKESEIYQETFDKENSRGQSLANGITMVFNYLKNGDEAKESYTGNDIAQTVVGIAGGDNGTLSQHYNSIYSGVNAVKDDPIAFVKCLAKYGLGQANSYLFGAALGRVVAVDHIGTNSKGIDEDEYADSRLKSLGVVDGVEGLNFKRSTVFSSQTNSPMDINLICTYDVEVFGMLGDFTVSFANSASARAWLDGDCTTILAGIYESNSKNQNNNAGTEEVYDG